MNCPHTALPLIDNDKWQRGTDCNGVWLTGESVRSILGEMTGSDIELKINQIGQPTNLPCPNDGRNLTEVVVVNGITVDCCSQCNGVWFDKGELEALAIADSKKPWNQKDSSGLDVIGNFDLTDIFGDILDAIF